MNQRSIGIGIIMAMAAAGLAVPTSAAASSCRITGQPPSPGTLSNELFGVAVISRCDIWAVGDQADNETSGQTLIDHWDGKSWTLVASPNPGGKTRANDLRGVAAISATNIWAVGDDDPGSGGLIPMVIHWNGTRWRNVTVPPPASNLGMLEDVEATSASNIWAVGETCPGCATDSTLTYHWNGKKWRLITSPSPNDFAALRSVAAVSPDDVWAVGNYFNGTATQTLTLHWDGKKWHQVASPDPGGTSNQNILFGVAASSSKHAWAVGKFYDGTATETLTLRWNGKRWVSKPSPNPSATNNAFSGVVSTSSRSAWAVGEAVNAAPTDQTLAERWTGRRWVTVTSSDAGPPDNRTAYDDVAALSPSSVIAVGTYSDSDTQRVFATVLRH